METLRLQPHSLFNVTNCIRTLQSTTFIPRTLAPVYGVHGTFKKGIIVKAAVCEIGI